MAANDCRKSVAGGDPIATYKTAADMPEELRKALPDEEKLKELLSGDR